METKTKGIIILTILGAIILALCSVAIGVIPALITLGGISVVVLLMIYAINLITKEK